ncbi:RpS17 [Trypoxylus dichotomus]
MGRVRTKTVKKASKVIIEKYYTRLTLDFHTNKRICEEIAVIPTKPLRNKIAGFVTHLMKRLRHSQVRVSALEHDIIEVDPETKEMLKMLEFNNITGLQLTQPTTNAFNRRA